ncbi:hypothetical protein FKM82_017660 [Ascaphus truei]
MKEKNKHENNLSTDLYRNRHRVGHWQGETDTHTETVSRLAVAAQDPDLGTAEMDKTAAVSCRLRLSLPAYMRRMTCRDLYAFRTKYFVEI